MGAPHLTPEPSHAARNRASRRPRWRQTLVTAERGLVGGLRGDGTLFGYLFADCLVLTAGFVLGLSWTQWSLVTGAVTLSLTAELLNQALRAFAASEPSDHPAVGQAAGLATAAAFVAVGGSAVVVAIVFWQRLEVLFAG